MQGFTDAPFAPYGACLAPYVEVLSQSHVQTNKKTDSYGNSRLNRAAPSIVQVVCPEFTVGVECVRLLLNRYRNRLNSSTVYLALLHYGFPYCLWRWIRFPPRLDL